MFLILVLIASCNNELNLSDKVYSDIQGDWLYTNSSSPQFFSIKDSLVFWGEHIDSFKTFRMKNDTLDVINSDIDFHFSKITNKFLKNIDKKSGEEIPVLITSNIYRDDMITLRGLEVRFKNDFRGLLDWGMVIDEDYNCFIKIEFTRRYAYIKNPFDVSKGIYKYEFNKSDFEFIQNKLRNVPFDKLKNRYISDRFGYGGGCIIDGYDQAIIFLEIKYSFLNSTEIKTKRIFAKGFEGIPAYLGVFINYLNKINTFAKISDDKTTFDNFIFYSDEFTNNNRGEFFPYEGARVQKSP